LKTCRKPKDEVHWQKDNDVKKTCTVIIEVTSKHQFTETVSKSRHRTEYLEGYLVGIALCSSNDDLVNGYEDELYKEANEAHCYES
jgi:hypothetical protein